MAKLKEDPAVQELVGKEVAKAVALAQADHKRAMKQLLRDVKAQAAAHADQCKVNGLKGEAREIKLLGDALQAHVKQTYLAGEAA